MRLATPRRPLSLGVLAAALTLAWTGVAAQSADEAMHEVTVAKGDTLIGLSRRLLADPRGWPAIARLNGLRNPNAIRPGQVLRVPFGLMTTETAAATVLRAHGAVTADAQAVRENQTLAEGARLSTAADASATVRLVDGTVLRLRGGSSLHLEQSRQVPAAQVTQSRVRLEQGRVEVQAPTPSGGRPGFRVGTPQGVLAVRGTDFRVAVVGGGADGVTRGEVLEGVVQFSGSAGTTAAAPTAAGTRAAPAAATASGSESVAAGFGSVIAAGARPLVAMPLLGALDAAALGALPALHERLLVRIPLPPATSLPGTTAWRAQVATSADFDRLLVDQQLAPGTDLRLANLDDGDYLLRLRGVDARSLEGRDAMHRFRLKARPEPPLPLQPPPGRTVIGNRAELQWAEQPQAARYRVQLARDAAFTQGVRDWPNQSGTTLAVEPLAPGLYHWRVGSLRTVNGAEDRGPWGDARSFEMRLPPPAPVAAPPAVSSNGVDLAWPPLAAGQKVEVQLAADNTFAKPTLTRRVAESSLSLPLPGPGRWFLRLRSIDADGFEGPWGGVQSFEVFNCLRDTSGECVRAGEQVLRLQ